MLGSGPDDGDIIEMAGRKPRRPWPAGGRSRRVLAVAGVCLLLAVAATVAAVRLTSGSPSESALTRLITEVSTVPVHPVAPARTPTPDSAAAPVPGNAAFSGSVTFLGSSAITPLTGARISAGGKPEVLYIGTGYCPYCAAQNWALIVALSRFGRFSGLRTSRSPAFEGVPPVDGWTFYRSSYASRYLTFVPVETYSNVLVSPKADPAKTASYRRLQRLTPAQRAVFDKIDESRSTPFLDFGGRAGQVGTEVSPQALARLTWSAIAAGLRWRRSPAGQTILAAAEGLTAEFCQLTGDRPAAACHP